MNKSLTYEYFRDRSLRVDEANLVAQLLVYPNTNIYKSYGMANLDMGSCMIFLALSRGPFGYEIAEKCFNTEHLNFVRSIGFFPRCNSLLEISTLNGV